jgi:hypothetical protein
MDRKEKPISAPSIHVGALVGAGSLWPFSASFWSLLYKAEWNGGGGGVAFSASFWDLYAMQKWRGPIGANTYYLQEYILQRFTGPLRKSI